MNVSWKSRARAIVPALTLMGMIGVCLVSDTRAQRFDERFEDWPVKLKINGRILVINGIREFAAVEGELGEWVLNKKVVCFNCEGSMDGRALSGALAKMTGDGGELKVIEQCGIPAVRLKEALGAADVVAICTGDIGPADVDVLRGLGSDCDQFLKRRGTLIVDAPLGEVLGRFFLNRTSDGGGDAIEPGLNLLPDCVLRFGFDGSDESKRKLLGVLANHPRSVGIGLEDESMLLLSGRRMRCFGNGRATFMLMANERVPLRVELISSDRRRRGGRSGINLIDLTEWRRDAIDRTLEVFPPADPAQPLVENGSLIIVGGGGMPRGLMRRFVDLAGGGEARLVYIPCSEQETVGEPQGMVEQWKRMGVENATFIHTKDRIKANTDEEFLAPLKDATGIWFGGGRQWNFADSYYGTKAHRMMKDVLRRGGVIGGSSAGASIQARYLARATPIGNSSIMAPGYERGGLGFLGGVAIDQHFSQRGRQKDMTGLVDRYPQLLGIGLDEATAIIVRKSKADVLGRGRVYFYDRNSPVFPDRPDFIALPGGSSYDLAERKVLVDAGGAVGEGAIEGKR